MIQNSDNGAATTLWKQIGGKQGLAAANRELGLTATVGGTRGRWGVTTTTAADQARLLRAIFTDQSPLDAARRRYLRSLMGTIAPDQDWGISAADSRPGTKFHVKNGWLPRTGAGSSTASARWSTTVIPCSWSRWRTAGRARPPAYAPSSWWPATLPASSPAAERPASRVNRDPGLRV